MTKYAVDFNGWAGWGTTVEIPDDDERLFDNGGDYDGQELAVELAYEKTPDLCAQCSGWGSEYHMAISEDWDDPEVEVMGDD